MEEIVAPDFGESVFEASVGRWFKQSGETVDVGEPIVELHTDKAVQEINAVKSGIIGTILKEVDDVVRPGDALCEFDSEPAETGAADEAKSAPVSDEEVAPEVEDTADSDEAIPEDPEPQPEPEEDNGFVEIQISPFVEMPPVVATEVEVEAPKTPSAIDEPVDTATEPEESTEVAPIDPRIARLRESEDDKPTRRERLSRRRLTIARRMAEVQAEAVMTTTYNEVDMHEVIRIRRDFGDQFMEAHGVKLGFMSFFVKSVLNGLKAFPILNSELDGNELVYKEFYDIGIAVASDEGLVVPVIRDADKKSFADIEHEIRGYAEKAGSGSFSLADLVGGTFTITNGGVFGSMMSTPILNPPQVGILGMHNIVDRPVVVDGRIDIRPMMYLAVTYDHRVVEGAHAVQFLVRVKESLEAAELLMLAN